MAHEDGETSIYRGIEDVLINPNADIRIFNKPTKRKYRRMGVVLVNGDLSVDVTQIKEKAIQLSKLITIK